MTLLLFPHGGGGNHGCEAIVRSTREILDKGLVLCSNNVEEDKHYGLNGICRIERAYTPLNRKSIKYLVAWFAYHLFSRRDAFDKLAYANLFNLAKESSAALSIGGDNYCYGKPEHLYLIDKHIRRIGRPLLLWGCSIEPAALDGAMLEDLQNFTHIFARESITFQALKNAGIEHVSLYPDPAFCLNSVELPLPQGFIDGNTVGLNISPMIIDNEAVKGITMRNYCELVEHIISFTDMNVALIPHVVWSNNDDRIPLRELYDKYSSTGRIVMIPDHNAEELKGYISRCRFMVAARTHASIAAYSSKVPTLVLGYSVKARGISRDLFGSEENYVIPVQSLKDPGQLTSNFKWLMDHEKEIRDGLNSKMPDYIARLEGLKNEVSRICFS